MTNKEIFYDILQTWIIWILLWVALEWIMPGPVKETSLYLYFGALLGYTIAMIQSKSKYGKSE